MTTRFPVLFLALEGAKDGKPADRGWDEGYRFMIEHIDCQTSGDCHFFKDRPAAEEFMRIHGMVPETLQNVLEMRANMARQRESHQ